MSDHSETSRKEKYLPYVDQDSDFFFLFFLLKFIAITQSHFLQGYCQASVIPLEIGFFFFCFFTPHSRLCMFPLETPSSDIRATVVASI